MSRRPVFVSSIRLVGLSLLVLLGACAQQNRPGYYDTPRENTASDALHRAQGDAGAVAPSQLQFGFGPQSRKPAAGSSEAVAGAATSAAVPQGNTAGGTPAATASRGNMPPDLRETRTYLGTVPCPDSGACAATRMTLTLAPDGQWRARNATLGKGPAQAALGCWFLVGTDPARIVLESGDHPYATLELIQPNVLKVTRLNGRIPLLESRLTRQADIDPIDELASQPARACPAR
ncbi:MAG TPA: hypothetical protein VHK04_06780 [Castellaniella sp.]|jgi:hypothetical protein|nr:hypothetical protein [Castellaniella sp.]